VQLIFDAPTLFFFEPRDLRCADGVICEGLDTDGLVPAKLEVFGMPQKIQPFRSCLSSQCYANDLFKPEPLPLTVAPTLPTATVSVVFYNKAGPFAVHVDAFTPQGLVHPNLNAACALAGGYDIDNPARPDPKRSHCVSEPWQRDKQNVLVVSAPYAVGKNISVRLEVWDDGVFVSASDFQKTTYLPPSVSYSDPSIVYLDDGEMEAEQPRYIKLYGANFARDESVNGLKWPQARRLIAFMGSDITEAKAAANGIVCGGKFR
jgi:hypothetical protein